MHKVIDYYTFHRVIGKGHFGVVREASRIGSDRRKKFAVKTISKEAIGSRNITQLRRELDILVELDHPNIIKVLEIFEDVKYIHIVTDICYGGDIFDWTLSHNAMTETKAAQIMQKLFRAVSYMHSLDIVHRDIKPANILFTDKTKGSDVKLIDLGLANKFKKDEERCMHSCVGSPFYMAPEVLRKEYGKECDLWSLGILLFFMLSGCPPFLGSDKAQVYHAIQHDPIHFDSRQWSKVSSDVKDLITRLLEKDPAVRLTISEALSHKWFDIINKDAHPKHQKTLKSAVDSLRTFHAPKRIKCEWMKILVKYMTDRDVGNLKDIFLTLDKGQTGYITETDLRNALSELGQEVAASEVSKIIREVGFVGQHRINYSEFLSATVKFKQHITDQILFETFQHFDVERHGYLTKDDLKQTLARDSAISWQQITHMVAEYRFPDDTNISFQDFKTMLLETTEDTDTFAVCPIRYEYLMDTAIFHGEQGDVCLLFPQIVPTEVVEVACS